MRETFANIGISIASNTALFTGLDLGQWIADKFSLWALPANLIAALIATAFPLALTAASRVLSSPTEAAMPGTTHTKAGAPVVRARSGGS
jgi:hypothetical protein